MLKGILHTQIVLLRAKSLYLTFWYHWKEKYIRRLSFSPLLIHLLHVIPLYSEVFFNNLYLKYLMIQSI